MVAGVGWACSAVVFSLGWDWVPSDWTLSNTWGDIEAIVDRLLGVVVSRLGWNWVSCDWTFWHTLADSEAIVDIHFGVVVFSCLG